VAAGEKPRGGGGREDGRGQHQRDRGVSASRPEGKGETKPNWGGVGGGGNGGGGGASNAKNGGGPCPHGEIGYRGHEFRMREGR